MAVHMLPQHSATLSFSEMAASYGDLCNAEQEDSKGYCRMQWYTAVIRVNNVKGIARLRDVMHRYIELTARRWFLSRRNKHNSSLVFLSYSLSSRRFCIWLDLPTDRVLLRRLGSPPPPASEVVAIFQETKSATGLSTICARQSFVRLKGCGLIVAQIATRIT